MDLIRLKALRLYRIYEAILVLTNSMTVETRKGMEASKNAIKSKKGWEVRNFVKTIKMEVSKLKKHYGVKVSNLDLLKLLEEVESAPPGLFLLIPKYFLKEYFEFYNNVFPDFNDLPDHIRVGVDRGTVRQREGYGELYLLEAKIFEDMCALFNLSREQYLKWDKNNPCKKIIKFYEALSRATIAGAFYLLEAYLNGIAFDYYIKNKECLDEETITILTEWDSNKNRPKYVAFRDKALQYPRILLGASHPPFQENNCPDLAFIIEKGKSLRDAIVHASPMLTDLEMIISKKEGAFFRVDFMDVEQMVDNAIALIRKIEAKIYGNEKRLFWLKNRGGDGYFCEEVFG